MTRRILRRIPSPAFYAPIVREARQIAALAAEAAPGRQTPRSRAERTKLAAMRERLGARGLIPRSG